MHTTFCIFATYEMHNFWGKLISIYLDFWKSTKCKRKYDLGALQGKSKCSSKFLIYD